MSRDNGNSSTNRRNVLKATAGLVTVPGVTGIGGAVTDTRTRLERVVDEGHRILEQTGDRQKYLDHFDKRTNANWIKRTYTIRKDDDASTEEIDRSDLDISMLMSVDCYGDPDQYYVDLAWNYDYWYTENPADFTGLIWDHNWWDLYYPDSYGESLSTSDYVNYEEGTFAGQGPVFGVDDLNGNGSSLWCGAYITPIGDYSSTQRRVYGRYTHTWDRVEVESVSVGMSRSGPSLSVTLSDNTKKWQTDTEQDGDSPLYLQQNDAYC